MKLTQAAQTASCRVQSTKQLKCTLQNELLPKTESDSINKPCSNLRLSNAARVVFNQHQGLYVENACSVILEICTKCHVLEGQEELNEWEKISCQSGNWIRQRWESTSMTRKRGTWKTLQSQWSFRHCIGRQNVVEFRHRTCMQMITQQKFSRTVAETWKLNWYGIWVTRFQRFNTSILANTWNDKGEKNVIHSFAMFLVQLLKRTLYMHLLLGFS